MKFTNQHHFFEDLAIALLSLQKKLNAPEHVDIRRWLSITAKGLKELQKTHKIVRRTQKKRH